MSNNTVLKVINLNKSFSGITAAIDLNLSVNQGEIVGIIGANGAGKTVFVNMITGYLKPTSGTIQFLGSDITGIEPRDATHIGLCRSFQISQIFMTMTVKENLMIAMSLAKKSGKELLNPINDKAISKECDKILDLYKIKDQKDIIVSTLSQGIRKLLDIAMAVVGNPKAILLDEPTSGVSVEEKFARCSPGLHPDPSSAPSPAAPPSPGNESNGCRGSPDLEKRIRVQSTPWLRSRFLPATPACLLAWDLPPHAPRHRESPDLVR